MNRLEWFDALEVFDAALDVADLLVAHLDPDDDRAVRPLGYVKLHAAERWDALSASEQARWLERHEDCCAPLLRDCIRTAKGPLKGDAAE
jgi:hypothetical protein